MPSPDLIFLITFYGLMIVLGFWPKAIKPTANPGTPAKELFKLLGMLGGLIAMVLIAGIRFPFLSKIWAIPQLSMKIWILTFLLMIVGIIFELLDPETRRNSVAYGAVALTLNTIALAAFLWTASVSPGGV